MYLNLFVTYVLDLYKPATRRFAAGLRLPCAAHKEQAPRKVAKFMPRF